jgi:hypothetical protein
LQPQECHLRVVGGEVGDSLIGRVIGQPITDDPLFTGMSICVDDQTNEAMAARQVSGLSGGASIDS